MATRRKRLTFDDRQDIETMIKKKVTIAEIAKVIGCHRDTIYKEMKLHMDQEDYAVGDYAKYDAKAAQCDIHKRRDNTPHRSKVDKDVQLEIKVEV